MCSKTVQIQYGSEKAGHISSKVYWVFAENYTNFRIYNEIDAFLNLLSVDFPIENNTFSQKMA